MSPGGSAEPRASHPPIAHPAATFAQADAELAAHRLDSRSGAATGGRAQGGEGIGSARSLQKARREGLDERLSRLATDERHWPTVGRLRAFRGVDTLTALALHLELGGDWAAATAP